RSQRFWRIALVQDGIELAVADGIEYLAMQLAQHLLSILIAVLRAGCRRAQAIGNRALPDTAPPHEDLRLQQLLAFTRFALHVVDGIFVPNVGIKAKNHAVQVLPSPVSVLSSQVPPDETRTVSYKFGTQAIRPSGAKARIFCGCERHA